MAENEEVTKKKLSADWFMRGALTKIGDAFDQLTGRNWTPSSTLATSELSDRLKKLIDAKAREVPGKGTVVPHNIKLKMQWDKFSADEGETMRRLESELLTAAADHINDNLYYTYAPLHLEVKPDYFTEGVKLLVSFEQFADDEGEEAEMNVTMPSLGKALQDAPGSRVPDSSPRVVARFTLNARSWEKTPELSSGRFTVGRTGGNGLVLDDISVSKVHASVAVAEGALTVADTGSTNGTFLNGKRIAYGKAVPFSTEDAVTFGTVEVTFELHEPKEPPPAPESGDQAVTIDGFEFRSKTQELSGEEAAVDASEEDGSVESPKGEE